MSAQPLPQNNAMPKPPLTPAKVVALPVQQATHEKPLTPKQAAQITVAKHIADLIASNSMCSDNKAFHLFVDQHKNSQLPPAVLIALSAYKPTVANWAPSVKVLPNWMEKYRAWTAGNRELITQGHKGRQRKNYGWEKRAVELRQQPTRLKVATIARMLQHEGYDSAEYNRVRTYLNSVPKTLTTNSPTYVGEREHRLTRGLKNVRDTTCLNPGSIYQGDGHTIDVYLSHPTGRRPWRAELTVWIDVASRYIVGWALTEAESGNSTLFALSHAIISHDHVPAMLHIDNGSGYRNKMVASESTGFYDRLGISIMFSKAYNPTGKGQVERFFRTMEDDFGRRWKSYCGYDFNQQALQDVLKKHKAGEQLLPSADDWKAGFVAWLDEYHNRTHRGLNGKTPAQVWAGLQRNSLGSQSDAIWWPREKRVVSRCRISLHNRQYEAAELMKLEGDTVTVEYSLHDDSYVRILKADGLWFVDAQLTQKQAYLPDSRLKEADDKRERAAIKRKEADIAEIQRRNSMALNQEDYLENIDVLTGEVTGHLDHNPTQEITEQTEELDLMTLMQDISQQEENASGSGNSPLAD